MSCQRPLSKTSNVKHQLLTLSHVPRWPSKRESIQFWSRDHPKAHNLSPAEAVIIRSSGPRLNLITNCRTGLRSKPNFLLSSRFRTKRVHNKLMDENRNLLPVPSSTKDFTTPLYLQTVQKRINEEKRRTQSSCQVVRSAKQIRNVVLDQWNADNLTVRRGHSDKLNDSVALLSFQSTNKGRFNSIEYRSSSTQDLGRAGSARINPKAWGDKMTSH